MARNFKAYENDPLAVPAEAAGPKAEYLEYHLEPIFQGLGRFVSLR